MIKLTHEQYVMKAINTSHAPQAIGPYSQAIVNGDLLFLSGQIPLKANGNMVTGDISEETRQCFSNLNEVAKAAGSDITKVIKLTIYTTDLSHFTKIGEVCKEFLSEPYPARATVQVSALPKDARVEIDAVICLS